MIEPKVLKARVDEILRLANAADALVGRYGTPEHKAAEKAYHDAVTALDREAKLSGAGCQPGRLLKFGVADGYARYVITRVNKKTCKVVHIPYMGGYKSPAVHDDEVWRDEAEDNIAWYDTLMAAAEKLNKKPELEKTLAGQVEPNMPPLPVVQAEPEDQPA